MDRTRPTCPLLVLNDRPGDIGTIRAHAHVMVRDDPSYQQLLKLLRRPFAGLRTFQLPGTNSDPLTGCLACQDCYAGPVEATN